MKRSNQGIVGSDPSRNQRARIGIGNGGGEVRRVENPPLGPGDLPAALSQLSQGHLVAADPEGSSSSSSSNAVQPATGNHAMARSASTSAPVPPLPWAGGDDSRIPAHLMPHRKPKNFADRLMRVLLNGSAPDTLWWVGDGKAVAVHARNLKRGSLLDSYFKVKDYNAFIRNCNRWGFSKTNQYVVPDGVKVYQCSLFQRDAPHLMLHMRIDSDVQDVFMRHVDLEDQEKKKSSAGNGQGTENGARASSSSTNGGGNGAHENFQNFMLPMAQQSSNTTQAPQAALQNNFESVMRPLNGATQRNNTTQDASQDMIQTLMRLVGNATATQPSPAPSGGVTVDGLLDQIMSVSEQYLRQVANEPPSEINQPIQTLIQLLQIHIRKYNEHRAEQERQKQQQQQQQPGGTNMNAVEPLLRELLRAQFQNSPGPSTQGTQPQQQPQQQQQQQHGNFGGLAPATPMNQQMQPAPAPYFSPVAGPQQVPQGTIGSDYQQYQGPLRQTSSSNASAPQPTNTGGQGASSQQNAQNALGQFLMQFMQQNNQGENGSKP